MPSRPLRSYESRVAPPGSGLKKASRLVANQVRTISKRRVGKVIGRVTADEQEKLDQALTIQLALGS